MKHLAPQSFCYLRFFHAFPNHESYDLYIDDAPLAKDILYQDFTKYFLVGDTHHTLTLCKHGTKDLLLTEAIHLSSQKIYTLILYATQEGEPLLLLLNEPPKKIPEAQLLARAVNLSVLPTPLKLYFQDTKPTFKRLASGHYSSYLSFPTATYQLCLQDPATEKIIYERSNVLLKPTRYYSFYLVGGLPHFPLQVIQCVEGNSLYHFDEP